MCVAQKTSLAQCISLSKLNICIFTICTVHFYHDYSTVLSSSATDNITYCLKQGPGEFSVVIAQKVCVIFRQILITV